MTLDYFLTSYRSSSEAGRHSDAGLSSWIVNDSRDQKEWSRGIRACNRPSWSGNDVGKTQFVLMVGTKLKLLLILVECLRE